TANFAAGTVGVLLNDGVWAPRASGEGAAFTSHSSVVGGVPAGGTSLQREITWAPVNLHPERIISIPNWFPVEGQVHGHGRPELPQRRRIFDQLFADWDVGFFAGQAGRS